MSKIEVNQISSQCGSTLTVGQSGDTVTLAAGATQTGFGRTGTVDWDTTAKTASFTAVSGNGYFVNTTSGAITVTMPASPSAGDIVALQDYAGTWGNNNVTIGRNGSNVGGAAVDATLSTYDQSITLVYVDATRGWQTVNDSTQSVAGPIFITATGGTVTCCGDYKIHTFTGPGTFCVSCRGNALGSNTVDYLVIAGGAGGGGCMGGGGGAGGFRESSGTASGSYTASPLGACVSALPVSIQGYPITVGSGGGGGGSGSKGSDGSVSTFSTITSAGGGAGGASGPGSGPTGTNLASNGGSGGGQRAAFNPGFGPIGGSGNTPPVSPPQGNNGGKGFDGLELTTNGGGGGGAGAAGSDALPTTPSPNGGPGGNGVATSITGSSVTRAGGGGGGSDSGGDGSGGSGGGGGSSAPTGNAGTVNTGSGGGGGSAPSNSGGNGGDGIVIIRYKFQ